MNRPQSITSLPESPDVERHRRMVRYGIAMSVRVGCVIACFFVQGWWLLLPLAGAVILPYIAVIVANVGERTGDSVTRPGAVVGVARPAVGPADE